VAEAVHQALNKLPADRFGSAVSFAEALTTPGYATPARTPTGVAEATPAPQRVTRKQIVIAALGAVGIAVAFVAGRSATPVAEPRVVRLEIVDTIRSRCCGGMLALSPDGSRLVVTRDLEDGSLGLAIRTLDRLEMDLLPGTEDAAGPFFSPDGRWVGFEAGGRLRKVALAGGPPITIAEVGNRVRGASWASNDSIVFANDEDDRLYRVAASGGQPERVSDGEPGEWHRSPWILPGNRRVLFAIDGPGPLEDIRIGVLDLQTGTVDTLETPGTMARYAASGHLVFTGADGALLVQPFDPGRGQPTGPAVALLDGVLVRGDGNGEFAVSQAGDVAYVPGGSTGAESLVLATVQSETPVPLPRAVNLEDPAISPDGRRIVLRLPDEGDQSELWLLDRDQGTLTRFTTEGSTYMPVWSPDGSRIAYAAAGDTSGSAIYWRAADGSGTRERLLALDRGIAPLGFLPDGRRLLVQGWGGRGGSSDIGVFTLGDSAVQWLAASEFRETRAQASPDGRWFAYTSGLSGQAEVYVQGVSGGGARFQISTGGGFAPRWSPDGRGIYYGKVGSITVAALDVTDRIRVRSREVVFQGPIDFNGRNTNYDVDPTSGDLLLILQEIGGRSRALTWILGWPAIVEDMATAR
jgi:serine/threonine-protein kinase